MENNSKEKNELKFYMSWPLILSILVAFIDIVVFVEASQIFKIVMGISIVYFIIAIYLYFYKYNSFVKAFFKIIESKEEFQTNVLDNHQNPYVLCSLNGHIMWQNKAFTKLVEDNKQLIKDNINIISKEINKDVLYKALNETHSMVVDYNGTILLLTFEALEGEIVGIYLMDITKYESLKIKYDEEKVAIGLIYIDNYEEALSNIADSNEAIINALVDRKLTRYLSNNSGIIKKLEKDKYIFVTNKKNVREMMNERFSILDETKEINAGNDIPITLSIGVGVDGRSIEENFDYARIAIDMALGRGGGQAVVKNSIEMLYYGGKTSQQEKYTRVRSRVKAKSFREVLDTKDKVLIVGHKNADFDSLGSAIGVYVMAKFIGKDVHIVQNSVMQGVEDVIDKFVQNDSYDSNMFISGEEALNMADNNTLLVLVDHNTPAICDEERLVPLISTKAVFDHHRKSENYYQDAVLQHIDPNASSASELVSEMLEYFDDKLSIRSFEAGALLLGIVVDTNYFSQQTSAKTFDAASYLKKNGADLAKIRNILKIPKEIEIVKNEAIQNVEIYKDSFAIANIPEQINVDLKLVVAETANELIHIQGVKASIVLAKTDKVILVSARSIDQVNVQVLMEKLGGGGHKSQAACQLKDVSMEEAVWKIKDAIDEMFSENEIS